MRTILMLAVIGCSSAPLPAARFANAPIVTSVDDRRHVAQQPEERDPPLMLYYFDGSFYKLATRGLELRRAERARGVNALDEVPDSTWFTNRIGVRDVSLDEIRRGPAVAGSPEPYKPWTVKAGKVGGRAIGFVIVDARGEKYLLKFDNRELPEAETAAEAISSRIAWAAGYNVPENHVVYLRRSDLIVADDATRKDRVGRKKRMTAAHVDKLLAKAHVHDDGTMRGIASRMLDGEALGGHPQTGVRDDDPNDRIRHELRRDLRGQRALFAWLDHVDVKEHNTLDVWVKDPAVPDRRYVKHYLVDFGKTLGVMATGKLDPRQGHTYYVDYGDMAASLVTAGLRERSWEGRAVPPFRGLGLYDANAYDPEDWRPNTQVYTPLYLADRFDAFWGAKILARFTREQLQAAVETGRLTDPRAAAYLVDTLVTRQQATVRYWFARVAPLDRFEVVQTQAGPALCFDDLAIRHHVQPAAGTAYAVTAYDRASHVIAGRRRFGGAARACTPLAISAAADGYTMVRIDAERPGTSLGTIVHLARAPQDGAPRVIGVWRL